MNHTLKDKELKELLKARRLFEEGWKIIDKVVYAKYIHLADRDKERRIKERRKEVSDE